MTTTYDLSPVYAYSAGLLADAIERKLKRAPSFAPWLPGGRFRLFVQIPTPTSFRPAISRALGRAVEGDWKVNVLLKDQGRTSTLSFWHAVNPKRKPWRWEAGTEQGRAVELAWQDGEVDRIARQAEMVRQAALFEADLSAFVRAIDGTSVAVAAGRIVADAGIPHCAICGRGLDDTLSKSRGIGPECWGALDRWHVPAATRQVIVIEQNPDLFGTPFA